MENWLNYNVLVFFILSLIIVILFTMKTVLTVKGGKVQAILINILTYSVYTVVIKLITEMNLAVAVVVTIITNAIGVWIALIILKKLRKDKLWRISCTIPYGKGIDTADITDGLKKYNIEYTLVKYEGGNIIDIFSKTQGESELIKEIINNKNIRYTVLQVEKKL